jgi:serine/threonine protein kinase
MTEHFKKMPEGKVLNITQKTYNDIMLIKEGSYPIDINTINISQIIDGWVALELDKDPLYFWINLELNGKLATTNDKKTERYNEMVKALQTSQNCNDIKTEIMKNITDENAKQRIQQLNHQFIKSFDDIQDLDNTVYNLKRNTIKLGEGQFGSVFKTRNLKTNQLVAVKQIKNTKHSHNFLFKEINFLIDLCGHYNIVKLLDVRKVVNKCSKCKKEQKQICKDCEYELYLIFEYHETDFAKYINTHQNTPFGKQTIQNFIHQLLSGLKWMHFNKVVHRDVKPANILYNQRANKLEITDFGASYKLSSGPRETAHDYVTIGYRAPELFNKHKLGQKTHSFVVDSWSIGIILLELLTMKYKPGFAIDLKGHNEIYGSYIKSLNNNEINWESIYNKFIPDVIQKVLLDPQGKISKHKLQEYIQRYTHIDEYKNIWGNHPLLNLLEGLLTINPTERFTTTKALESSWLRDIKKI